jgi:adenylate kinase family enzyme
MKLQNPFGDEIRAKVEELKDIAVAEYEKTRNKKKDPELDRSQVKVRLPDEMLYKIVRSQLNTAACKNKGFILDGYPRTQADGKAIFFEKQDEGVEPNPDDAFPGYTINTELLPQYVILLQGDDAALKQRVKEMAPEKTANTHYNEAQMDRRLKIYRDSNVHDSGQSVQDLFTRCFSKLNGEIPISENFKNINAFSASEPEIFGELQDFIEKNGKPCCLNLITDKDNKFLKNLTKANQAPATHEGGEHHDGAADEHKEAAVDEDDELAIIMKNEEEDNRKRAEEEKEQKAKEHEE